MRSRGGQMGPRRRGVDLAVDSSPPSRSRRGWCAERLRFRTIASRPVAGDSTRPQNRRAGELPSLCIAHREPAIGADGARAPSLWLRMRSELLPQARAATEKRAQQRRAPRQGCVRYFGAAHALQPALMSLIPDSGKPIKIFTCPP